MDKLTVVKLKKIAKDADIEGYYKMKKAELIEKLTEFNTKAEENITLKEKEVWWYYNIRYSETGCVSNNLNKIYDRLKYDGIGIPLIELNLKKYGKYDDNYKVSIKKVKFHGILDVDEVYILRCPLGIYSDKKEAYKTGVMYIINDSPLGGKKYKWSRVNDWDKKTITVCDDEWFKKVGGSTLSEIEESGKDNMDWKEVWEARIEEDQWSSGNHIEWVERVEFS